MSRHCHLARAAADPRAFVHFHDAYAQRVLVFFTRRVFDAETAMDLTAETFARAYEARGQFRGGTAEEEQGWLFAIARSQLSAFWHRGAAEREAVRRLGIELPPMVDAEIERIEELAGLRELAAALEHALLGLPEDQAVAVRLRVMGELSYEEVAAALGVRPATARARVSRGLRALAGAVRPADNQPGARQRPPQAVSAAGPWTTGMPSSS